MTNGATSTGAGRGGRPRPAWEVLDAARARAFTGMIEFASDPPTSVYFERGAVYLAECEGDPPIGARLVAAGALTVGDLDAGAVDAAGVEHLGRIFDRVAGLDRALVVAVLEGLSDETLVWIAAQTPPDVVARPYVRHPSGVDRWYAVAPAPPAQLPAPLPPSGPRETPLRGWRTPPRPAEPGPAIPGRGPATSPRRTATTEVQIDWMDDTVGAPSAPPSAHPDGPSRGRSASTRPGERTSSASGVAGDVDAGAVGTGAMSGDSGSESASGHRDAAAAHGSAERDALEGFAVVWPSGEVAAPRMVPPPPAPAATGSPYSPPAAPSAALDPPPPVPSMSAPAAVDGSPPQPSAVAPGLAPEAPSSVAGFAPPPIHGPTADVSSGPSEQMRLAVRRTIAAIEDGMASERPMPRTSSGAPAFDAEPPHVRPAAEPDDPRDTAPDLDDRRVADRRDPTRRGAEDRFDDRRSSESQDSGSAEFSMPSIWSIDDPFEGWGRGSNTDTVDGVSEVDDGWDLEVHVRRGTLADRTSAEAGGAVASLADDRRTALRRMIDGLRGR